MREKTTYFRNDTVPVDTLDNSVKVQGYMFDEQIISRGPQPSLSLDLNV